MTRSLEEHVTTTAERSESATPETQDALTKVWTDQPGLVGWFTTVQNGPIASRYIVTTFLFFLSGGIMALLMRTQLAVPESTFLGPETFNQLFTMHG
ncbi:MAG: cbb3-type cytochrome c oxidase subunit I, partial [Chloroflexi bacterium]|nr:cbb3-type cytochrome c oxidase subunit I [Chloroflexota bacterium]